MTRLLTAKQPRHNVVAGTNPLITDDDTKGYGIGSRWIVGSTEFVCVDASTGAASWIDTTAGATGGAQNLGVNIGTGTVKVFEGMNGDNLEFNQFEAQTSGVAITTVTNNLRLSATPSEIDHDQLLNFAVNEHFPDADADGSPYVRQDNNWVLATGVSGTDLGSVPTTTQVTITSSTGTNAVILAADASNAGVMTAADRIKLDAITSIGSGQIITATERSNLSIAFNHSQDNPANPHGVLWSDVGAMPDVLTTAGDVVMHNGSANIRLARGTNGQVLKSTGTTIQWDDETGGVTGPGGGVSIGEITTYANTNGDTLAGSSLQAADVSNHVGTLNGNPHGVDFLILDDVTESTYVGAESNLVKVNAAGTGLEFVPSDPGTLPTLNLGGLVTNNGAANVELPAGANGLYLRRDDIEATGLKWDTASGAGDMNTATYDLGVNPQASVDAADAVVEDAISSAGVLAIGKFVRFNTWNITEDMPNVLLAEPVIQQNAFGCVSKQVGTTGPASGLVTTDGIVRGLDTSGFAQNEVIWLDSSGEMQTRPTTPTAADQPVAICVHSDPTVGVIYVVALAQRAADNTEYMRRYIYDSDGNNIVDEAENLNNGTVTVTTADLRTHLDDVTTNPHATTVANLTDTAISAPADDQAMFYSGGNWVNRLIDISDVQGADSNARVFTQPTNQPLVNEGVYMNATGEWRTANTQASDTVAVGKCIGVSGNDITIQPLGGAFFQSSLTWDITDAASKTNSRYALLQDDNSWGHDMPASNRTQPAMYYVQDLGGGNHLWLGIGWRPDDVGSGGGQTFTGLDDTLFTGLQDNQIAKWNDAQQKWINAAQAGGGDVSGPSPTPVIAGSMTRWSGTSGTSLEQVPAGTTGEVATLQADGSVDWAPASAGSGDVTGPGTSTLNAVVVMGGTTGKVIAELTTGTVGAPLVLNVGGDAQFKAITSAEISDFQTAVSANTDVTSNTTNNHTHANKALLDTITNAGGATDALFDDGAYKTVMQHDRVGEVGANPQPNSFVSLTAAEYGGITPDANTLYLIVG